MVSRRDTIHVHSKRTLHFLGFSPLVNLAQELLKCECNGRSQHCVT